LLNRKNIISVLIVIALIAVIVASSNRTQHGDTAKWMKEHGVVAARHPDVNGFCVDCHQKKFKQTKENYCNKCHQQHKIKLIK
jgi:cytochrome c553